MKKLLFISLVGLVLFTSCKKEECDCDTTEADIFMGANQTNDVYYSFINGEVSTTNRTDWDLAFSVPLRTATICINEGAGMELYKVGDTTVWESIDTSGMESWTALYNDKSDWMRGAFNLEADGFDYDWAIYNSSSHNVIGQYIYVIKLSDGSYKKLYIIMKNGTTNSYILRWANIDGSNQVDASFSPAEYTDTKHFIHYSLVTNEVIEAEPDMDSWDLLFTRYMAKISTGPDTEIDYPVMGVLLNKDRRGLKVFGIPPADANYSDAESGFTDQADIIGWEWKEQDPVTHEVSIVENTSYFVKYTDHWIYKIYFTDYAGAASGSITIQQQKVE